MNVSRKTLVVLLILFVVFTAGTILVKRSGEKEAPEAPEVAYYLTAYESAEDVLAVVQPVLCHRLVLSLDASIQNATADGVLTECLKTVPVPPVSTK